MSAEPRSRRNARIAPMAPLLMAAVAGVAADRYLDPTGTAGWASVAMAAVVTAALAWGRPRACSWAILAAFGAIAGGWHHYRWSDLEPDDLARAPWVEGDRRPAWVRGVLVESGLFRKSDAIPGDRGSTRTVLAISGLNDGRGWRAASGRALVSVAGDRSDLEAGRAVEAAGALSAVAGPLNPGEFDARPYYRAQGIRLRLAVDEPSGVWPDVAGVEWPWTRTLGMVRAWSLRTLSSGLDPADVPLASALLLGRREAVDPSVNDAFARTGTTHLLAISGLHLQVLAVFLGFSARSIGMGRKGSYWVVAAATIGYAVLVGLAPSVVRSAAMTLTFCLACVRDRCARPANTMSLAGLATLAFNPADLFDVGCQLSFLAVAAIVWLVPKVLEWDKPELTPLEVLDRRFEPWWKIRQRMGLAYARAGLIGSTVVWLASWPLVALRFHLFSPVGILINIPLIPLTSMALLLSGASLGLSAIWPPLGLPFGRACGWCLRATEALVRWSTDLPWGHWFAPSPPWAWSAAFYAIFSVATVAGVARWRSRRKWWWALAGWGLVGFAIAMVPDRPASTEVHVLAVGHGLAVVVRSPAGKVLLYDCGRQGDPHVGRRVIAPALWSSGLRKIDVVVLSHADADHFNGLPDLLDRFEVGVVRVPPGFESAKNPAARRLLDEVRARGIKVQDIGEGDAIDLGAGTTLAAIQPRAGTMLGSTDNARSVVLEVASGGRKLLLTGDLERDGLAELIAKPPPGGLDAMLSPHHGGKTSNPPFLYAWAKPALVLSSQNPPTPGGRDPLAPIAEGRFPVLRTWQAGEIRLSWQPSGLVATGFLDEARVPPRPIALVVPRWSRWPLVALGLLAGSGLVLILTVREWGAWSLVLPGRRGPAKRGNSAGEPIEATAIDGTTLAGAWFPSEPNNGRTILLLHGLAEDREALLGRVPALNRRGWNVATLDARACGQSGGHRVSFGGREADDVVAWLDVLSPLTGPDPTFAAWGRSMGAATVVKAAASDPRLAALILEAPYHDLKTTVAAVLRRFRIPGLLASMVLNRARELAGVSLDRPRPIDLAPGVRIPVMILHGALDPIAPILDARVLAAAFPGGAEIVEVPEAGHANVVGVGGETLMDRVGSFLDRVPSPNPA